MQPTNNDEPMLAPCNAHTDLMWVSDKPKVLVEPASVSSDQLRLKIRTGHGPNEGEDYQWEFTPCVLWGEGWVGSGGMRCREEEGRENREDGRQEYRLICKFLQFVVTPRLHEKVNSSVITKVY